MLNTSPNIIGSILRDTESFGVKVPATIAKAYARHETVTASLGSIYQPGELLVAATVAALEDGRDPAVDPEVQRIVTSQAIGNEGVTGAIRVALTGSLATALNAGADDLVKAWQKPFAEDAETIRRTAQDLGTQPLEQAESILRKGGDIAQHWIDARAAVTRMQNIVAAWTSLAQQSGFVPLDRRHHMLKFTDPNLDQWTEFNREGTGRRIGPWEAHALGLPLSLADSAEYLARYQHLEQDAAARDMALRNDASGRLAQSDRDFMNRNLTAGSAA